MFDSKSFAEMMNSRGPSIDPCGTPMLSITLPEVWEL
ncbi:unnamed protein product [Tenebrio molitor]|nr:unnamed protein product [Tenebrio molitor]